MTDTLKNVIRSRRTIRKFIDKDISTEAIIALLQDASYAPNHKHREPWSFVLFRDSGKEALSRAALRRIVESNKGKGLSKEKQIEKIEKMKKIYNDCPVHLLVLCEHSDNKKTLHEDFAATCAFIQNFQLLAWEQGIGMVWKTPGFMEDNSFLSELKVDSTKKFVGLIHIGYPQEVPKVKDRGNILTKLDMRL
jgi:nitroreductase